MCPVVTATIKIHKVYIHIQCMYDEYIVSMDDVVGRWQSNEHQWKLFIMYWIFQPLAPAAFSICVEI